MELLIKNEGDQTMHLNFNVTCKSILGTFGCIDFFWKNILSRIMKIKHYKTKIIKRSILTSEQSSPSSDAFKNCCLEALRSTRQKPRFCAMLGIAEP